MLSRERISVPHEVQADRGVTIERPAGSLAATTFRKLPIASPGAKTSIARATFTLVVSTARHACLSYLPGKTSVGSPIARDGANSWTLILLFGLPPDPCNRGS